MWQAFRGLAAVGLVFAGGALGALGGPVDATRQYGAGVHDYFRGCYHDAVRHLDAAAAYANRDPRVYFYRGLAKLRLGWSGDARADFLMGAQLEVALNRQDVGRALERVQGSDRMLIERFRREASLMPRDVIENIVPQPIESVVVPADTAPRPPARPTVTIPNLPADQSDPFREDATGVLGRGELQPATEAPTQRPAAPAAAQDEGMDPFAEDVTTEEPVGSGIAAEAESDADVRDPFATDEPAEATPPAEADRDPFAEDASEAPSSDAPAEDTEDPFGDDDPFAF